MKSQFTEGPIYKQLFTMIFAAWIGMFANIAVGFIDMFYLSYLQDPAIIAAVGFSASLMFISGSLGIGFSVATGVLVSQRMGKDGGVEAGRSLTVIVLLAVILSAIAVAVLLPFMPVFLSLLGAEDDVASQALNYLVIIFPSAPLAIAVMIFGAGLRSIAAAKASMWVSLSAALINLILDPIFIFGLNLGLEGAAWATFVARAVAVAFALYILLWQKHFLQPVRLAQVLRLLPAIRRIAVPAVLTNLLTPVGSLIVVAQVAKYGTEAMAGLALVGSISPLLFSVFFAMTGAAGPMMGQNIGANQPQRVAQIYRAGLYIILSYTVLLWAVLALSSQWLIDVYQAEGLTAELLHIYCLIQVPMFAGLGVLALSNGVFNNLGKPLWSTLFNGSRATIATLVFCFIGGHYFGLYGVVIGSSFTFAVFGVFTFVAALSLFRQKYPNESIF